jgi:glycyl-tRNA synthetase
MTANGHIEIEGHKLDKSMVTVTKTNKRVVGETVTPSVIEPSFGIGRILYCMFEHAFYQREGSDEARQVLKFAPIVAPTKCSILPLINDDRLSAHTSRIAKLLTAHNISSKVDTTGSTIGKRYARTDEIGVPFGITIDFQTLEDDTVTLRERDSMRQVRIKISELVPVIMGMINDDTTWDQVMQKYPVVNAVQE